MCDLKKTAYIEMPNSVDDFVLHRGNKTTKNMTYDKLQKDLMID